MPQMTIASKAKRALNTSWVKLRGNLRKINQTVPYRPQEGIVVPIESNDETATFKFGPLVLHLPEKPSTNSSSKVYVVIKGNLTLEQSGSSDLLRTRHYQTQIGYFREQQGHLKHIFGAHYDLDPNFAHPIFHAQISTQADFATDVSESFTNIKGLHHEGDRVKGLLGNVRVPTSQMDFFSVLLQVISDHLINEKSPTNAKESYLELCKNCRPFASFGLNHNGLSESRDAKCFRSSYWYEH